MNYTDYSAEIAAKKARKDSSVWFIVSSSHLSAQRDRISQSAAVRNEPTVRPLSAG